MHSEENIALRKCKVAFAYMLLVYCRFSKPIMGSYADQRKSERESHNGILDMSLELQEDEGACIIKWRISNSCGGVHILRKLFSQFIKEIVEEMIGYVRLPSIMSKLLSDNGSQEFGDFKLTILGMLGTYGFERRILVCIHHK